MTDQTATEATELDKTRIHLVPAMRIDLPSEPDHVHLALYAWMGDQQGWSTDIGLCGRSVSAVRAQHGVGVDCPVCLAQRYLYERVLNADNDRLRDVQRQAVERAMEGNTTENGAWFTVWLEGKWSWVTKKMTTPQREYAADCVAAYCRYLAACDEDLEREEPEGLRWWREGQA